MSATETVRAYYEALRAGEPLARYFAERDDLVKVGITERLAGHEAVAAGLREQTRETSDWRVESRDLRVADRDDTAWFSDDVQLAWTERGRRREYDSRWSGALVRVSAAADVEALADTEDAAAGDAAADDHDAAVPHAWRFVGMHVSAPH